MSMSARSTTMTTHDTPSSGAATDAMSGIVAMLAEWGIDPPRPESLRPEDV